MNLVRTMGGLVLLLSLMASIPGELFGQDALRETGDAVMGIPTPVIVPGTPTCADLNASIDPVFGHITEDWGFRIIRSTAVPFSATFPFLNGPDTQLMGGAAGSPTSQIFVAAGGNTMSWLSNRPISAVIVQSELLGANVYSYNPASSGGVESGNGRGLTTPGGCAAVTGITFCFQSLQPTAAPASIAGRVTTSGGTGLGGATLTLQDAQTGGTWVALTNPLGYYTIENVPVGSFYVLTVSHRRHTFANATRTFSLNGNFDGADFIANP